MSKRAPVRTWVLVAISLWALTGLLPDRTAEAARPSVTALEQAGTNVVAPAATARTTGDLQSKGDPDDLLQGGDANPQPGSGNDSSGSGLGSILQIIVDVLNSWLAASRR